jgi:hypothetical protein
MRLQRGTTVSKIGQKDLKEKASLYLDNIADASAFVFEKLLHIDVKPRQVFNRRLATLPNDIIISFNYRTNIEGYISFFFSLKTAFMICERLVPVSALNISMRIIWIFSANWVT